MSLLHINNGCNTGKNNCEYIFLCIHQFVFNFTFRNTHGIETVHGIKPRAERKRKEDILYGTNNLNTC